MSCGTLVVIAWIFQGTNKGFISNRLVKNGQKWHNIWYEISDSTPKILTLIIVEGLVKCDTFEVTKKG